MKIRPIVLDMLEVVVAIVGIVVVVLEMVVVVIVGILEGIICSVDGFSSIEYTEIILSIV